MTALIAPLLRRAGALLPALTLTLGLLGMAALSGCSGDAEQVNVRGDNMAPESAPGDLGQGGSTARFLVRAENIYTLNQHGVISYRLWNGFSQAPSRLDSLFVSNWEPQIPQTLYPYDSLVLSAAVAGVHVMRPRPGDGALQMLSFAPRNETTLRGRDPVVGQDGFLYATLEPESGNGVLTTFELSALPGGVGPTPGWFPNFQPREIHRVELVAPRGLAVRGRHLYVCYRDGLAHFDLSNPRAPRMTHTLPMIGARDCLFAPAGHLVVVARSGLFQYGVNESNGQLMSLSKLPFGG